MSKVLGLRTVIYMVPDLPAAKDWYTKAFETEPYFDEPFYVGFDIAGYELGLHPQNDPRKASNAISYWGVQNIRHEFEKFMALGATAHEQPQNVGGEIMVASLLDPWGNVIGLIYNPEFSLS